MTKLLILLQISPPLLRASVVLPYRLASGARGPVSQARLGSPRACFTSSRTCPASGPSSCVPAWTDGVVQLRDDKFCEQASSSQPGPTRTASGCPAGSRRPPSCLADRSLAATLKSMCDHQENSSSLASITSTSSSELAAIARLSSSLASITSTSSSSSELAAIARLSSSLASITSTSSSELAALSAYARHFLKGLSEGVSSGSEPNVGQTIQDAAGDGGVSRLPSWIGPGRSTPGTNPFCADEMAPVSPAQQANRLHGRIYFIPLTGRTRC